MAGHPLLEKNINRSVRFRTYSIAVGHINQNRFMRELMKRLI